MRVSDEESGDEVGGCWFKGSSLLCIVGECVDAGSEHVEVGLLHHTVWGRDCLQGQGTECRCQFHFFHCSHDLAAQFAHSLHGKRVINRECALFMHDDSAIDYNGRHIASTGSGTVGVSHEMPLV